MKYRVVVAQIAYGDIVVEASSRKEARKLALESTETDSINWEDSFHTKAVLVEECNNSE